MNENEITSKIIEIFQNRFNIPLELLVPANFDLPLTGNIFKFTAVDLVYLFYEIEQKFQIYIDGNNVANYQFNSIRNILMLVYYAHNINNYERRV